MIEDELELKDLYSYLKNEQYEEDVCEYIMTTFRSLRHYYKDHSDFDLESIDYQVFLKKYIDILKHVKRIIPIRDINQSRDFFEKVLPVRSEIIPIGYNKDENGHYVVTTDRPQYYCTMGGLTNNITSEVSILFDDTVKHRLPVMMESLIHELTHAGQQGFDVPWYIINRNHFIKCLREGNAMREARYINNNTPAFYNIPFNYNNHKKQFEKSREIPYQIYKYIYFKLETLLGHNFMSSWSVIPNDTTILYKANKLIDSKYGSGTFKKIYTNIMLILFSMGNDSKDNLQQLLEEQKNMVELYDKSKVPNIDDLTNECKKIDELLNNDDLFKKSYETNIASLLSTKTFLTELHPDDTHYLESINQKIANHTEGNYRSFLENNFDSLKNEVEVRMNIRYFKTVTSNNIKACQEAIDNSNYFTKAIISLESIVLKCLLKDMSDPSLTGDEKYKKYRYYIYNTGSNKLNYEIMDSVKYIIDSLELKAFLQTQDGKNAIIEENQLK